MDAILVGRGTLELDNPTLNTRLTGRRQGRDPLRVVLDTRLRSPVEARAFDSGLGGPSVIACGEHADVKRVRDFESAGIEVWPLPLKEGRVSLSALLKRLGERQVTSLLIEGGAEVNAAAIVSERIADRILFFFAPKIIGGRAAPGLVGGEGLGHMDEAIPLDILRVRRFGGDIMVEAAPRYRAA
jgi:diaminohydroxyphosphoribosylaminopyrimidine deaminase/5-amino-6-(5-phosphoribosylamino)uracil reductase